MSQKRRKCEKCGHREHDSMCGYGEWAGGSNVVLCRCGAPEELDA